MKNLKPEDYLYERFGKRGWQCEKCNNFNFEIRTKCNRCGSAMKPKLSEKEKEYLEKNWNRSTRPEFGEKIVNEKGDKEVIIPNNDDKKEKKVIACCTPELVTVV